MKKLWKAVIIIAIILIIGVGSSAYYFLKVKTYNIADKKVDKIVNEKYNIVLPGQSTDGNKSSSNFTSKNNSTNGKSTINKNDTISSTINNGQTYTTSLSSSTNANNGSNKSKSGIITAETIKEMYTPTFQSLESQANGKIDSLIAAAINEYKTKKTNGTSISFAYFYQKYNAAGSRLESQTDGAFNYIYRALQNDLKKNHFNPAEANSFKTQYENEKKQRESSLIQKAKSALL